MPPKRLCLSLAVLGILPFFAQAAFAEEAAKAGPTVEAGTLPTATVLGTRSRTSYDTPVATTATKIPAPLREIPQSVNVVPRAVIQDQGALSLNDTLRNVPGVSASLGDAQRDQVTIRGFSAINDQYVDGLRDDALYFRDLSNVERIEVLKGPAAVLYGRGSSGGIINRVTKKPLATPMAEVGVLLGTEGQKRAEFDLNTSINDDAVRARLTGAVEDSGGFRNDYFLRRQAISPSFLFNLSPDTKLTLQFDYLHDTRIADQGVPSYRGRPVNVPIETRYGSANAGDGNVETTVKSVTGTLDHRINDQWSFHSVVRNYEYALGRNNYVTVSRVTGGAVPTVTLGVNQRNRSDRGTVWQNELTQQAETFGIRHTLLYGIELGYQDKSDRVAAASGSFTYNLFNPVPVVLPTVPANATPSNYGLTHNETYAMYAQDLIKFSPQWTVLAGLRYEVLKQSRDDLTPKNQDLSRTDKPVSPRLGIVYHPVEALSLYASYSRSFQPLADSFTYYTNSSALAPQSTTNYEIGAKYDVSANASVSAALFDMKQTNLTSVDPATQLAVPIGTQRTRGLELSFTGEVVKTWSVIASYAYLNGVLTNPFDKSNGVSVSGNQPSLTPRHSGSLWVKHDLPNGFYVAGGLRAEGARFASQYNVTTLPGYMTVDLGAGYRSKHVDVTLNLQNLFNRAYYVSAHGGAENYNLPGAPRMALLGVRYKM
ncbi:TonB-dependent receptor [Ralstonia pseudosolanacearum]|uniref:TonB-dependent receptor n=1 Tax=Ralstonia pseudosolanacearum TaxID=1310165 RepID=UPI002676EB3B|nr:TonB-dependent siderophore receptor [Ralstonia pseudosolanacearum]MDO3604880.1 TonB-dependent siderophore receptor [Ralstonia pseudosolanacearum]MDO3611559.1 TonB-dependent siderophore receptor [Ralstonia pseudosolanacearum]MDO3630751.1 TonB-dependent siderophore receptor [Ralstonia pseudosolanacearum]